MTKRQAEIIDIVKMYEPIKGDDIAVKIGISRSGLRTDLQVLTQLGYLDAKPKVGYSAVQKSKAQGFSDDRKVSDVMSVAVTINEKESIHSAIIMIFMEDVGSIFIMGDKGLSGIVSRKDLVKAMMGNRDLNSVPVSMIMTRMPNVVTIKEDAMVQEAVQKLILHEIDSLPVIRENDDRIEIVGRFTKTNATKMFAELINATR